MDLRIPNGKTFPPEFNIWQKLYCINFAVPPRNYDTHLNNKVLEFDKLILQTPDFFKIDTENNANLERDFANQIAALRARGEGYAADRAIENKPKLLQQMANEYADKQREQMRHIHTEAFFAGTPVDSYPQMMLLFNETFQKVYKGGRVEKRVPHKTLDEHMIFKPHNNKIHPRQHW
jgi:hypothetical protein